MTVPALGKSSANIEAVYMLNGDVITGKFVKFDPKLGLVWEAANIKPALQINPEAIDRVTSLEFPTQLSNGFADQWKLFFRSADRRCSSGWL